MNDLISNLAQHLEVPRDQIPTLEWLSADWFAKIFLRSTVKGDLGFPWPTSYNDQEVLSAYLSLMNGDYGLVEAWRDADRQSNLEVVDPNGSTDVSKSLTTSPTESSQESKADVG
ncbi:MAG: hypothetical protein HC888_07480 [Candidatus Competibacteraceae bacterium]|nr:hypothetical protein [Candidatus Competibacteraceae bacterium]